MAANIVLNGKAARKKATLSGVKGAGPGLAPASAPAYTLSGHLCESPMSESLSPIDRAKRAAAHAAAELVQTGMRVGLGTGSTAAFLVQRLGDRLREEGLAIVGVPTSERTADLARAEGIEIVDLDKARWLDITIDGADEVDGELNLIKGGGGALLREKIVATASERVVIIADRAKRVEALGAFPLPVEVIPFGWEVTQTLIQELLTGSDVEGREAALRRRDGLPVVTDQGNLIVDLHLRRIGDARQLALALNQIPGVVENGLFLDICDTLILGSEDGSVEVMDLAQLQGGRVVPFPSVDNIFSDIAD
jgi:ribose 5-phosphate isomerase A